MPSFLDAMVASRPATFKEQLASRQARHQGCAVTGRAPSLIRSLRAARDAGRAGIIAELKRSSPTHGPFAGASSIASRLKGYDAAGVAGISVITEPSRFNGSYEDLVVARQETTSPVLCKDFNVTLGQLQLASDLGASAALIIAKARESVELLDRCLELDIEPVIEIHDVADLDTITPFARAHPRGCVVGINNRDLDTLDVNLVTTEKLLPLARRSLGDEVIIIAESGIEKPADATMLRDAGVDGFLIGTAFMNVAVDGLQDRIAAFTGAARGGTVR